jgi:hypothetical protein
MRNKQPSMPTLMEVQAPRPMAVHNLQTHRSHRACCNTTNPTFSLWYASCAQAASFASLPLAMCPLSSLIFVPFRLRPLSFHALLPAPCQTRHPESSKLEKVTDRQKYLQDTQTDEQTRLRTEWLFGVRPQESPVSAAHLTTEQRREKRAEQRAIKKREKMLNLDQHFALNFAVQNEQNIRLEIAQVLRYDFRLNFTLLLRDGATSVCNVSA